jgi:hypothetical protein
MSGLVQSYVERPAPRGLHGVVSSTWVQRVETGSLVHRDVPSGSVEVRCRVGGEPEVIGPLTRARVEAIEPGRRWSGCGCCRRPRDSPPMPASELVDEVLSADDVWPGQASGLAAAIGASAMPSAGVEVLLRRVAASSAAAPRRSAGGRGGAAAVPARR